MPHCDLRRTATHTGPGATQRKAQGMLRLASVRLGPADFGEFLRNLAAQAEAALEAQLLKGPRAVLGGAGSQGVSSVGQAVFTWLMQIQIWCLPAPAGCVRGGLTMATLAVLTPKRHDSISPVCFWRRLCCCVFAGVPASE